MSTEIQSPKPSASSPTSPLNPLALSVEHRARIGWTTLRLVVAGIIAAHGWARWWAGGVVPFGTWLDSQGWPAGLAIAVTITALEIAGSALLAWGRWVLPLCIAFSAIYAMGIVLVHAKAGWFVVGLGRNGAEFSVLLITCLATLALQHPPKTTESR
ncbi:MAG: DoxX family protein [Betaproteobacteria bacterium]|nr:DoxX family protein [Betaproteobacteria bacterium]